jgi:site-specific DNA recombinase
LGKTGRATKTAGNRTVGATAVEQPVTEKHLFKILHNRYYCGIVTYEGVQFDGRHDALISKQLFYDVQAQLLAHDQAKGKRARTDHYLKGSLFCGRCREGRIGISYSRGRHGERYLMAYCLRRHNHKRCDMPYVLIEHVETAVESYYQHIELGPAVAANLRDSLVRYLEAERERLVREQARCTTRVARLKAERVKLLKLYYADAIAEDLFASEQRRIDREIATAEQTLTIAVQENDSLQDTVNMAVDLAANCHRLYREAPPATRHLLNQAFFEGLFLNADGGVSGSTLAAPFATILSTPSRPARSRTRQRATGKGSDTTDPEPLFAARGSSTGLLVGEGGVEPLDARFLPATIRERAGQRAGSER